MNMLPNPLPTKLERKHHVERLSRILDEFIPTVVSQVVTAYIMDNHEAMMWRLIRASELNPRHDLLGFVCSACETGDTWLRYQSADRYHRHENTCKTIILTNGIDSMDESIGLMNSSSYSMGTPYPVVTASVEDFWSYLSESESPLNSILMNVLQDADHAAHLRETFRSRYVDYTTRVLCAATAARAE